MSTSNTIDIYPWCMSLVRVYYTYMVELTDAELQKWKEAFAKDGIVYDNDNDYREAVSNLVGYFDVLIQMDMAQKQKNKIKTD